MNPENVSVVHVKSQPPDVRNPHVTKGITSKQAAQKWAALMGASIVYWNQGREKAYCPREVSDAK